MSRYIDADKLCDGRVSNDPVVIAAKCAPEENVAQVVHAHWVPRKVYDEDAVECSHCKNGFNLARITFYDARNGDCVIAKSCPICSAKMDEKESEDHVTVAELADAADLKSADSSRTGSSPVGDTIKQLTSRTDEK